MLLTNVPNAKPDCRPFLDFSQEATFGIADVQNANLKTVELIPKQAN